MTTRYQKNSEMAYANQVAKILGYHWQVASAPNELHWPDLLVTGPQEHFGLEVREIYPEQLLADSQAIVTDGKQAKIEAIKQAYEQNNLRPLRVNFIGDIDHSQPIIAALNQCALTLNDFEQMHVSPCKNTHLYISALPINASNHERWLYAADNEQEIPFLTKNRIVDKIKEKSAKLNRYSKNINDVRLLLVCNVLFKLSNTHNQMLHSLSANGFNKVYLLSFPNRVDVIG